MFFSFQNRLYTDEECSSQFCFVVAPFSHFIAPIAFMQRPSEVLESCTAWLPSQAWLPGLLPGFFGYRQLSSGAFGVCDFSVAISIFHWYHARGRAKRLFGEFYYLLSIYSVTWTTEIISWTPTTATLMHGLGKSRLRNFRESWIQPHSPSLCFALRYFLKM